MSVYKHNAQHIAKLGQYLGFHRSQILVNIWNSINPNYWSEYHAWQELAFRWAFQQVADQRSNIVIGIQLAGDQLVNKKYNFKRYYMYTNM